MTISCDLWPMSLLTKPVGEKDRKLIVHPKDSIIRSGIKRNDSGKLEIWDESKIKIPYGAYFPEDKEQGHRHIWCKDNEGNFHLYGRRLNVKGTYTDILVEKKLWQCREFMDKMPYLKRGSALDLELCWDGHPDSEIPTAIKDHPDQLHPYFFAVLIWDNKMLFGDNSLNYLNGRELLEKVVSSNGKKGIDPVQYMTKVYKRILLTKENRTEYLNTLMNKAEEIGKEGFVLKKSSAAGWYKVKGINEADVFVIGFKISNSETLKGQVTGVRIGVVRHNSVKQDDKSLIDMGNVSGFNQEERDAMTSAYNKYGTTSKNPYMHKVLRVMYQEVAGKGKMKHGFRECWREDKSWLSCSYSQFTGEDNS